MTMQKSVLLTLAVLLTLCLIIECEGLWSRRGWERPRYKIYRPRWPRMKIHLPRWRRVTYGKRETRQIENENEYLDDYNLKDIHALDIDKRTPDTNNNELNTEFDNI